MNEKIITFMHASGVKKASFPTSDIQNFKITLDKCLKGELHAITLTDDEGIDNIYPSIFLQNCHIEIKDKVKPTGIKYRNI